MVKIDDDEVIKRLKSFGLTQYEAEIYLLLLKYRVLAATKLGELSRVPITRIYDIAHSLIEKGLIGVVRDKPRQYGILPFKSSFDGLISKKKEDFRKEINILKKDYSEMLRSIPSVSNRDIPETEDFIFTLSGKKAVTRAWNSMFYNTKKELFIFSGDSEWVTGELPKFKRMGDKKIDIRIIADSGDAYGLELAADVGVKIMISNNKLRGIISDGQYLYVSKRFTSATKDEDYSCFLTEHKGMVESMREYFLMKWADCVVEERKNKPPV